jgi:hypothetical protein
VCFATITLCVASQQVFIVVSLYFVIDSVRKLLDTPSYLFVIYVMYLHLQKVRNGKACGFILERLTIQNCATELRFTAGCKGENCKRVWLFYDSFITLIWSHTSVCCCLPCNVIESLW